MNTIVRSLNGAGGRSGVEMANLHVLVVDDHKYARTMIKASLNAFGIRRVSEAASAVQALHVLQGSEAVDIILLDKEMPVLNGVEFTQLLRRGQTEAPRADVPIIMVSGHTDADTIEAARSAGVNAFLAKPVPADRLVARIRAVLAEPRPFVKSQAYVGPERRTRQGDSPQGERRRGDSGQRAANR